MYGIGVITLNYVLLLFIIMYLCMYCVCYDNYECLEFTPTQLPCPLVQHAEKLAFDTNLERELG